MTTEFFYEFDSGFAHTYSMNKIKGEVTSDGFRGRISHFVTNQPIDDILERKLKLIGYTVEMKEAK